MKFPTQKLLLTWLESSEFETIKIFDILNINQRQDGSVRVKEKDILIIVIKKKNGGKYDNDMI